LKKFISLLLVTVMLLAAVSVPVAAAPDASCYMLDTNGSYVFFVKNLNPTNSSVTFDLSMCENAEGYPSLSVNSALTISPTSISGGGATSVLDWGEVENTHWKKIEVAFTSAGCTVYVNNESVHFADGVAGRSDGLYLIGFPGDFYIDNVKLVSDGSVVAESDFSVNANFLNSDSSGAYSTVPSGSYYDFEEVQVADNAEFIFDSAEDCEVLTIGSEEVILVGDLNLDGDITTKDSMKLKKANSNFEVFDVRLADFDYNGAINAKDSLMLRQTLNGSRDFVYKTYGSSAPAEFEATQQSAKLTVSETTAEGVDATLNMEAINAEEYKYAVITYMTPDSSEISNSDAACQSAFGAYGNLITYDLTTDGKYHSQIVDLTTITTWTGDVATLRYFTAANAGDTIYIDSIVLTATMNRAVSVQNERENAKKGMSITDAPEPTGLGYYQDGNYIVPFDSEERVSYVSNSNNSRVTFDEKEGTLKATATAGADPSVYVDLSEEGISANTYKYVVYTYKVPATIQREGPSSNMYYVCGSIDVPTGGYECELFNVRKGDIYFSQIIDLSAKSNWSGAIKGIRLDYFSDCFAGDYAYIDSLVFCNSLSAAKTASNERLRFRNGTSAENMDTAGIWNTYRTYYMNMNGYEYIAGSASSPTMYFKFNSNISKFSARSLADRFARAITEATGYEVTCEIYNGYETLVDKWSNTNPSANVFYTLWYKEDAYIINLPTIIIKDSSYTDVLDRTADDVDPAEYNYSSSWNSEEAAVSGATSLAKFDATIGAHSNHELRLVKTPYGSFAVYPVKENGDFGNSLGGATFEVYRIYDDGSYKTIGSYEMSNHTVKPQIAYANGLVYILCGDDQGDSSYCSLFTGYFDPSKPNADGSYNITSGRVNRDYAGGKTPGGYGYSDPVIDAKNNKIYYIFNSGRDELGYPIAWFIYDMNTHQWETKGYNTTISADYRHCYNFAYPDGNGGFYFVGGRACLLECVGLKGIVYNVNYAWDRVSIFHIPNVRSGAYKQIIVHDGDYTQMDRELYPCVNNNNNGEAFISSNGYLHILTTESFHGRDQHDSKYSHQWHTVYKIDKAGGTPQFLYQEPITYGDKNITYAQRMVETADGTLYIIAMPTYQSPRVEVWKLTNETGSEKELVASKKFTDISGIMLTSHIISSNRGGSVNDDTVSCIFASESSSGKRYHYYTIELK